MVKRFVTLTPAFSFQNQYDNYPRRSQASGPSYANPINGVNDKTKEQKYGEDIMKLHEAYQVA